MAKMSLYLGKQTQNQTCKYAIRLTLYFVFIREYYLNIYKLITYLWVTLSFKAPNSWLYITKTCIIHYICLIYIICLLYTIIIRYLNHSICNKLQSIIVLDLYCVHCETSTLHGIHLNIIFIKILFILIRFSYFILFNFIETSSHILLKYGDFSLCEGRMHPTLIKL
jgi:hypothetical protein